jgi:hypothetical protein
MAGATIVFLIALVLLVALIALKYWEIQSGRRLATTWRSAADAQAIRLKELAIAARVDAAKLPPLALQIARILVRQAALALARLARAGERQLHRLADMASYKYHFERRETHSEFLRKVAESRERSEQELDTTSENGQNN